MTTDINELRRLAQAATPGPDGVSLSWIKLLQEFQQGANPTTISELLDRLDEAESDALEQARLNGMGASREAALMAKLEAAEKERTIDEQRIADLMAELNRVGQENEEWRTQRENIKSITQDRRKVIEERDALRASLEEAESDGLEQARLNGMGASREAALMTKLAAAETAWKVSDKSLYDLTEKVIPNPIDQIEAAEEDSAHHKALAESALRVAKGWEDKCGELRAKIETAEKDIALKERVIDSLGAELNAVANERDALQARIAAAERQEPVAEWVYGAFDHYPHLKWRESYKVIVGEKLYTKLYLAPGAKGE